MFDSLLPVPLSLQQYLFRAAAIVLVVGLHGWILALTARLFGDEGVAHDARLTVNPLVHLDIIGALAAVLYTIGWMRPLRIDADQLRGGRLALVICVLAACVGTCVIALLSQLLKPLIAMLLPGDAALMGQVLVTIFGRIGLWFGLANLLPLTPFTGGHVLTAVFPAAGAWLNRHPVYPLLAVALLIATGAVTELVRPLYRFLVQFGTGL